MSSNPVRSLFQTTAILLTAALISPLAAFGQTVIGHVNLTTDASGVVVPDGKLRTMSFNAVRLTDGSVKGEVQIKNRSGRSMGHAKVGCMVVNGNQAWLAATWTKVTTPGDTMVGQTFMFGMEDNGSGQSGTPDRITVSFSANDTLPIGAYCFLFDNPGEFGVSLFPVATSFGGIIPIFDSEGGNIQIRP